MRGVIKNDDEIYQLNRVNTTINADPDINNN